jgi:hypothetical protein
VALLLTADLAAAPQCEITLLDTQYEVFKLPTVGGQTLRVRALSNAIEYGDEFESLRTATAVGVVGDHAAAYSVENGVSFLSPTRSTDTRSVARDISTGTGIIVGEVLAANAAGISRAFRFSNETGFQFLDQVFPSVTSLATENSAPRSTQAVSVTDNSTILLGSYQGLRLLNAAGALSTFNEPACIDPDINNFGDFPFPGVLLPRPDLTTYCAVGNRAHNDNGEVVGELWDGDVTSPVTAHRGGSALPGGEGVSAGSINNSGWVGGSRGIVWSNFNERADLKEALIENCGEPASIRNGIDMTYVNDQRWLQWASWMMRPLCPQVSFSSSGTGFESFQGSPAVRVGNRFTVTLTIRNDGRVPLEGYTVTTTPAFDTLFRRISGGTLGGTLAPGESASRTVELEAIAPGVWTGQNIVTGDSNCGTVTFSSPVSRIVSIGEITKLTVNSAADRPRAPLVTSCDTGQQLDNGDRECTLRAALEVVNGGGPSTIDFNVPDVPVPTIVLQSQLPQVIRPVQIDGTTQGGGKVEIRGSPGLERGLHLSGGDSVVQGLVLNGFTAVGEDTNVALLITGAGNNRIAGNWIGTDPSGNGGQANYEGIRISGSPDNLIGGVAGTDTNIISGNEFGIVIRGEGADRNRVQGNRIGLAANGQFLRNRVGVGAIGGSGNIVGGSSGNWIAAREYGVFVIALQGAVSDTEIRGNRIGLDLAGVNAESPGSTSNVGVGVRSNPGLPVARTRIVDNFVAGHTDDIWISEAETTGTQVIGNRIGLTFDDGGSIPTGLNGNAAGSSVRIDGAPGVIVENNTIAGHRWGVLAAGSSQVTVEIGDDGTESFNLSLPTNPLTNEPGAGNDVRIASNTIGLNAQGTVPPGATQEYGVVVYGGARHASVESNTIAGHSEYDIWLSESANLVVAGNRIGTATGTDNGSQVGIWVENVDTATIGGEGLQARNIISRQADTGILVTGGSRAISIINNYIGTDIAGASAWSNGSGIRVQADEDDGVADLLIEDNVIGGSTGANGTGLDIENPALTQIISNRIGVSPNGVAIPNFDGLRLTNSPANVTGNVIATNLGAAIRVTGTAPVQILGNPVYQNGSGIDYATQPLPPPQAVLVMRDKPTDGGDVALLIGVFPTGAPGEGTIEVFGNRSCDDPQGRVPLLRQVVPGDEPLIKVLTASSVSAFGVLNGFTATVTRGDSTSTYSACGTVLPFMDSDDDGASDLLEVLGGDRNGDGVPDVEQANVATHLAGGDLGFVTLVSPPGTRLQQSRVLDAGDIAGLTLPFGLFAFDVQGLADGSQTTIDIILESGRPADELNYVKVPRVDSAEFRVLPETAGADRAERTGTGWRLFLTDGGQWDVDATVNGRLRDPGGPAIVAPGAVDPDPPAARRGGSSSMDLVTLALLLGLAVGRGTRNLRPRLVRRRGWNQPWPRAAN